MIAHIGGVPVEETLLPLLSGASVLVLVRTWFSARFRRESPEATRR